MTFKEISNDQDSDSNSFEERADQLSTKELREETIVEDVFNTVKKELISRGLILLEGPRGCGKTHMMRYVDLACTEDATKPMAVYVSFNRYLRLEPLLGIRSDALNLFQAWALALLVKATTEKAKILLKNSDYDSKELVGISMDEINSLISKLEHGKEPSKTEEKIAELLNVDKVLGYIRDICGASGRKRTVLLLDDAALTLSKDLLIEFFDLLRVLKAHDISPKASVYPGTTEYGPRFHVDHEGKRVEAWLSLSHPKYLDVMKNIAHARYQHATTPIPEDIDKVLMYAAFGIPRAYLTLLREWIETKDRHGQSALNQIIRSHREARLAEFRSLSTKLPTLATLVRTGEVIFNAIISELVKQNRELIQKQEKQLLIGIPTTDLNSMTQRMLSLLVEVGLIRQESEVSHGPERSYIRLMPHIGALIANRAFEAGRGGSARKIINALSFPDTKHPVRRSLNNLVGEKTILGLHLDEPPCQKCGTLRLSLSQKFCHSCGTKLLNESTFEHCMKISLDEVPGLSAFKRTSLKGVGLDTIGQFLAMTDPGSTIRRSPGIGEVRAGQVISTIENYVDEFLS
ncbi:hypothetical protein [Gluconobacter sp. GP1]|uniref:ORC-CDC6 family AAA ATPase n=1 Tax=Gluconobacter sp. GP1 TaxID=3046423 RepID=UPI00293E38FD|nr:hypothetical protein [Gluconobacter sp. GP1]